MTEKILSIKTFGDKKVKIVKNDWGYGFYVMRDGIKWAGIKVDDEMLSMMKNAIDEYFDIIDGGQ